MSWRLGKNRLRLCAVSLVGLVCIGLIWASVESGYPNDDGDTYHSGMGGAKQVRFPANQIVDEELPLSEAGGGTIEEYEILIPPGYVAAGPSYLRSIYGGAGAVRINIGCYAHGVEGLTQEVETINVGGEDATRVTLRDTAGETVEADIFFYREGQCHVIELFPRTEGDLETLQNIAATLRFPEK